MGNKTLKVSEDTHRALRIEAARRGLTVQQVTEERLAAAAAAEAATKGKRRAAEVPS